MSGQLIIAGPYRTDSVPSELLEVGDLTDAEFDILHSLLGDLDYFQVQALHRPPQTQDDNGVLEVPFRPTLVRRARMWNDRDIEELATRWTGAEEMAGEYGRPELHRALVALRLAAGPAGSPDDVRLVFGAGTTDGDGS